MDSAKKGKALFFLLVLAGTLLTLFISCGFSGAQERRPTYQVTWLAPDGSIKQASVRLYSISHGAIQFSQDGRYVTVSGIWEVNEIK